MEQTPPAPDPSPSPDGEARTLHYAGLDAPGGRPLGERSTVNVARGATAAEAGLYRSVLEAAGIRVSPSPAALGETLAAVLKG